MNGWSSIPEKEESRDSKWISKLHTKALKTPLSLLRLHGGKINLTNRMGLQKSLINGLCWVQAQYNLSDHVFRVRVPLDGRSEAGRDDRIRSSVSYWNKSFVFVKAQEEKN